MAIGFLFNLPIEIKGGIYQDIGGKILSCMQEIKQEFINRKSHFQLRLNTLIVEIIIQIDRMLNASRKQDDLDCFTYIKNYVDVHYNEKINFYNLAELSYYSYDHFRHKFKEFTGYSPNHYLIFRRIENAKEKLVRTNKNIIEIAMECGFSTSAQFCYLFKKYASKTPLEYRKKYK
ncbi:MAG: AraC family transcriptional regulator [Clostridia bacterium]|nr:AraC family transcriptional regulator [Clostridia bacterium]